MEILNFLSPKNLILQPINEIWEQKMKIEALTGKTLENGDNLFGEGYDDLEIGTIYHKSDHYEDDEESDM
jgi:hypothetical protein